MTATVRKLTTHSRYVPETAERVLAGVADFSTGLKDGRGIADLRRAAMDYLSLRGLPTPKLEGWTFTNLIPAVKNFGGVPEKMTFRAAAVAGADARPLGDCAWACDMLASGTDDSSDANADPALAHVCHLYLRDGMAIDVAAGVAVKEPLEMTVACGGDGFYTAHTVIRLGANASLTLIEEHAGTGVSWKNILTHIHLGPGARLTHVRVQRDAATATYTQTTRIYAEKDALYDATTLTTGAGLSRNQIHAVLDGPGATCHLNGVTLMRGKQLADATILIEHRAPRCDSRQNYRSVLDDQAHGVFQGKVHVHQPAQKTDGYQLSKAILLSEGAQMDTKPELEIYADDVKCSHGATTGQLDEEPLFYMRSRGIDEDAARALLIESFAADALEGLKDEALRGRLMDVVRAWLSHRKA